MTALTDAAARAPSTPGVYFFFGADDALLYVGKASNLRRRLRDHARTQPGALERRWSVLLDAVCSVHWEECTDEEAALAREADLIVLLQPPFNASHTEQDPHLFVRVAADPAGLASFELTGSTDGPGRVYGCFPHLARGAFSHTAKRTKAGYAALLRLLWVSHANEHAASIPSRIAGSSPPTRHRTPVATELRTPLHDYFTGRSARILPVLDETIARVDLPDYMRPALSRDVVAAREFFGLAPHAVRLLRLRHGLPTGAVPVDVFADLLAEEVRATIAASTRAPAVAPPGPRSERVRAR